MTALLAPTHLEDHVDADALIREARQIRRRRWLVGMWIWAAVTVAVVVGLYAGGAFRRTAPLGNVLEHPPVVGSASAIASEVITESQAGLAGDVSTRDVIATTIGTKRFRASDELFVSVGRFRTADPEEWIVDDSGALTHYVAIRSPGCGDDAANANSLCDQGWSAERTFPPAPVGINGAVLDQATSSRFTPSGVLAQLRAISAGKLVEVGHGTVDGVPTTEYRDELSVLKWQDQVGTGQTLPYGQEALASSVVYPRAGRFPGWVELFIDAEGRLREIHVRNGTTSSTTTFSSFNAAVNLPKVPGAHGAV